MPYIVVENFGGGMDVRRSSAAAPGGTMREIRNAWVNKGGEIEKRKAWRQVLDAEGWFAGVITDSDALMVGPIPTFSRDAVLFFFKNVAAPSASGSWVADGGGLLSSSRFGVFEETGLPTLLPNVFSTTFFVDEMIVSYGLSNGPGDFDVTNELYAVAADAVVPTSGAAISARSGNIRPTSGAGRRTVSTIEGFDSAIYAAPNRFSIVQSEITAPESDTGTGATAIDVRGRGTANGRPIAVCRYFSQLAVFCGNGIQFWNIDPDPAQWSFDRSIDGEALTAPRAIIPYGSNDILYLTANGIRSLRARDSSNFAVTTDIGSPIDPILTPLTPLTLSIWAFGLVIRESGQAIMFLLDKAYVLSRFPAGNVVAWAIWDLPEPDAPGGAGNYAVDGCSITETICIRNNMRYVYTYGDPDPLDEQYDATEATVITHYFGVEQPYTEKVWRSIDLACTGTWSIEYSIDPKNEAWVSLGSVTGDTHLQGGPQIDVSSPLIAFRFKTTSASAAKLSQFAIHFDATEIKA